MQLRVNEFVAEYTPTGGPPRAMSLKAPNQAAGSELKSDCPRPRSIKKERNP